MDIAALQKTLREERLDGWLLYDFHGQNPTARDALGLGGHMLTRRWFYLVPVEGPPRLLVHAIELGSFPKDVPGERLAYTSWQSLRAGLERLVGALPPRPQVAMEYCPLATIPYLSRVDAGTLELIRALGVSVVSSAELVQRFLCRWSPHQLASHVRALRAIDDAKDAAFEQIGLAQKAGREITETAVQRFLMQEFARARLQTDHAPIVAVNGHAGDPHYEPSETRPTPIRKGDLVLIDLWAKGEKPDDAYADITWVAFCGDRPPEKLQEIFSVTAGARDAGLAALREAWAAKKVLQGCEVDRVVRDHIAARGYGDRFLHRTGHSIGASNVHGDGANLDDLETHDTRLLIEGLAFSIEPGIYLPEQGLGVRSEIDVVMTGDGPQVFSKVQEEVVRIS
ncbi:M24 family metallopeptidase [Anaeromyxobacter paludicola]|uniref:Peptidase M24 n=1 Tax=Anaeromyxobacter paludicola TaxID=2918171 RepID=A0ABM7XDG3_9BACT|nr:Xaa-Pro peptidase family protein [Anaeromyxobacter paludicola]BDG09857.1 peptidase M24 [Anaeromyxobacter paludicola]